MDPLIEEMQQAVLATDGKIQVTWAFNLSGGPTMWGCRVLRGRKQVGLTLFTEEGVEPTPANALRALADLMEARDATPE